MVGLRDYSSNPDTNISLGGISIAEGWARASVNNAIREQLAEIADYLKDMGGGVLTVGAPPSYAVTLPSEPTVYTDNLLFAVTSHWTNTGAATLDANGLGARPLKKLEDGLETELEEGDFAAGHTALIVYRSTTNVFIILNSAGARGHSTIIVLIDRMTPAQRAGLASDDEGEWPYIDDVLNDAIAEGPGIILLPRGHMRLSSTINVYERIKLLGENNGGAGEVATQLIWDADMDGFVVHNYNTGELLGNASGTQFQGIAFLGQRDNSSTLGSGLWMRAPTVVKECMFEQWPEHGVKIVATHLGDATNLGNANLWHIENTRIYQSGSHGLYISGFDANAGTAVHVDVTNNFGSGIYDDSSLGNTYVGCHAAANAGSAYTTTNANSRSTFTGCYQENGQPASSFSARTVVVNGLFENPLPVGGMRIGLASGGGNQSISPFVVRQTTTNDMTLRLNVHGISLIDYIVNSIETNNGFSPAYYRADRQELQWRYNGLDGSLSVRVPTGPTPPHLNEADSTAIGAGAFILDKIWVPSPGTLADNRYRRLNLLPVARAYQQQTVGGDANFTLTAGTSPYHTLHTGTLTANRTIVLTNGSNGSAFLVTRAGTGTGTPAPTLSVGGLITLATGDWAEVVHDGAAWYLAAYGRAASGSIGPGDVVGPGIATIDGLARYATATGKLLKDSPLGCTLKDDGLLTAITVNASELRQGGVAIATTYAPKISPTFSGTPIVPTATAGTSTGQAASTQFVATAVAAASGSSTPIVDYIGTNKTLGPGDHNTTINCTNAAAVTLLIPAGLVSGVSGAQFVCGVRQGGTGPVTVEPVVGSGVTLHNIDGLFTTEGQYARLVIEGVGIGTNSYDLIGRTV